MERTPGKYSWLKSFEHVIIRILIMLMCVIIFIATIELAWIVVMDILSPPVLLLEIEELLDIFGFFLLILIGIELLETIKAYLAEQVVHSEIVLEVALIAIARKVIILDLKEYSSLTVIGIAALILSIAAAYYIVRRKIRVNLSQRCAPEEAPETEAT